MRLLYHQYLIHIRGNIAQSLYRDIKIVRYFHEYGSNIDDIIASLEEETEDSINRVLEILQNRIDQFGVAEPTIQKQGKYRILVELAGVQDSERARSLLQSTARSTL